MFKALFKRHININWAYHILLALDILWKLWLKNILEKANLREKSVCTLINKVGKGRWRIGNSFMQSSTLKHFLVLIFSIGLRLFKGFEEDVQDGALWPGLTLCLFFFSITVFFHGHWQIKREGTVFYSTLPLPSAHEHSDIYLQLCTWDDYRIFLIATLVFTRRDLPPYRITIWLIDDVMLIFVCLLVDLISGFVTSIWH